MVDTIDLKFRIPLAKIEEIKNLILEAFARTTNHIKAIAKIVSKLISFTRSMGPIARIRTRAIYRIIAKAANWNCRVCLDEAAKTEIVSWVTNIDDVSGFTIKISPSVQTLHFEHILHRDASGEGTYLGKICNEATTLVSEPLLETDVTKSSTFYEVKVFWAFFMKTNLLPFRNASILQFTDNKAAENILTFGSRNPEILKWCMKS